MGALPIVIRASFDEDPLGASRGAPLHFTPLHSTPLQSSPLHSALLRTALLSRRQLLRSAFISRSRVRLCFRSAFLCEGNLMLPPLLYPCGLGHSSAPRPRCAGTGPLQISITLAMASFRWFGCVRCSVTTGHSSRVCASSPLSLLSVRHRLSLSMPS